jgi:hypothetical protein
MRTLKGWITTTCLTFMLAVSINADTGVIVAGATAPAPCVGTEAKVKLDYGVIVAGIARIVAGFTGVIVAGATGPADDCGVIVAG